MVVPHPVTLLLVYAFSARCIPSSEVFFLSFRDAGEWNHAENRGINTQQSVHARELTRTPVVLVTQATLKRAPTTYR